MPGISSRDDGCTLEERKATSLVHAGTSLIGNPVHSIGRVYISRQSTDRSTGRPMTANGVLHKKAASWREEGGNSFVRRGANLGVTEPSLFRLGFSIRANQIHPELRPRFALVITETRREGRQDSSRGLVAGAPAGRAIGRRDNSW